MFGKTALALAGLSLCVSTGAQAGWSDTIDLDDYTHGTILNGLDLGFVVIDGDNFHNSTDHVVTFDTTRTGTRDRDLEGANGNGGKWDKGNLKGKRNVLGNILILQEIDRGFGGYTDATQTVVAAPDDEGRRRGGRDDSRRSRAGAGEISMNFSRPIDSFGFTLIDVEETGEFNRETGFFALFSDGTNEKKIAFADLIDPSSAYYDASIKFGDNSANRIEAMTAAELGLDNIESVTINLGGSGGVGDLQVTGVPTPTAAIAGVAVMGLLLGRRNRRNRIEA
jgi:hypothetical protein